EIVLARAANADRRQGRASGAARWYFLLVQLLIPVACSAVADAAARSRSARRAAGHAATAGARRAGGAMPRRRRIRLAPRVAGIVARLSLAPGRRLSDGCVAG